MSETVSLVPMSERGRGAVPAKTNFFSLLATITETKKEALSKKAPTVSHAAAALANKVFFTLIASGRIQ
jgi:hypothetical protein